MTKQTVSREYYEKNAREFYEDTVTADLTHLYGPFLGMIPEGGTILDAGCGSGRDSLYFISRSYEVTSFDGSSALVELSAKLIQQPVLNLTFKELDFNCEFDGVWACASLLHTPRREIDDVFRRLTQALKVDGILYVSFKQGNVEYEKLGRCFNCYDESSFAELLTRHPNLRLIRNWTTEDARPDKQNERWFNALIRKIYE